MGMIEEVGEREGPLQQVTSRDSRATLQGEILRSGRGPRCRSWHLRSPDENLGNSLGDCMQLSSAMANKSASTADTSWETNIAFFSKRTLR